MKPLTNAKHEAFAQALADGKSQADAYSAAGFSHHRSNASKLARADNIQARVASILSEREKMHGQSVAKAIEKTALTKEWVIEQLVDNLRVARAENQCAVANRSLELLGKELGMFVDRKEIRTGVLDDKSDDELDAIIRRTAAEAQISLGPSGEGAETKH